MPRHNGLTSNAAGFTVNANLATGDSQETAITHTNSQVTVKKSTTHSAITDQAGLSHINTENFNQQEVQDELNCKNLKRYLHFD